MRMHRENRRVLWLLAVLAISIIASSHAAVAADWPAYRANNARTATTAEKLRFPLTLAWKYVPARKHQPAWPDEFSILRRAKAFDYAPGPVIADRHRTDVYKIERPKGYDLWEFETSKLTNMHTHGTKKDAEFFRKASKAAMCSTAPCQV